MGIISHYLSENVNAPQGCSDLETSRGSVPPGSVIGCAVHGEMVVGHKTLRTESHTL